MTETTETTQIEIAPGQTLPFFSKKQDALLGHLLINEPFFLQARNRIRSEWFVEPLNAKLWKWKLEFFEKFQRAPSLEEFKGTFRFIGEDQGMRNKLYAQITIAQVAAREYGLDVIRHELTIWLKAQTGKAYTEKFQNVYNAAEDDPHPEVKFSEAFRVLEEVSSAIKSATFEMDQRVTFDDIASGAWFQKREVERETALTFGCPLVDKLLNTDCLNDSALVRGDHTVLLAPTNVGKTTAMVTIARHNITRGKSVLFITHEGRPDDIKTKLLQAVTGVRYSKLVEMSLTPEGQQWLAGAARGLSKFLVYLPLNKPNMTIEDVESSIRRAQEKRVIETGRGFDLIIDDYPAKLTTVLASRGHWPKRQIDEHIYNVFTQIALEFNCHVITAIQTNRQGSAVNRGNRGSEERLITLEDVSESWGAMTTATNVISLNRDGDAIARHRITFHICKSRSNETGWSITSKTDYGVSLTHGSTRGIVLPATYYRGLSKMEDMIDSLLEQFPNKSVPEHYYNC
jgi:hypothetical protein